MRRFRKAPTARHHVESLEGRLLLCDVLPPPAGTVQVASVPVGWATGVKQVLYVSVKFSDQLNEPWPSVTDMGWVEDYIHKASYRQTTIQTTYAQVTLENKTSGSVEDGGYGNNFVTFRADVLARIPNSGSYHFDMIRYEGGPRNEGDSDRSFANPQSKGAWLRSEEAPTAAHELGHNLGLQHASAWLPYDHLTAVGPGPGTNGTGEYANYMDVMGGAFAGGNPPTDLKASHFNAYEKSKLRWLPDANVEPVTASREVPLYAVDDPDAAPLDPLDPPRRVFDPGKDYAIRVEREPGLDYWIEYRQHAGWSNNPWVRNGIELVWGESFKTNSRTALIDTSPETVQDMVDAPLVIGRTFTDPVAGIHITPVRASGAATATLSDDRIDVQINFFAGNNQAPTIASAAPLNQTVETGTLTSLTFSVTGQDADSDGLAYYWEFEEARPSTWLNSSPYRTFGPNEPMVTKQWSDPGDYRVRVIVSDMKGKTAIRSWLVRVSESPQAKFASSRISGRVLDPLGLPVQDVLVSHGTRAVMTDTDGTYRMSLPASAAALPLTAAKPGWTFTAPGFAAVADRVILPGPDTVGMDFRGTGRAYKVRGNVSIPTGDPDTPAPARGVLVRAGPVLVDPAHWTVVEPVNELGDFTLHTDSGNYGLRFEHNGLLIATRGARVDFGDVGSVNLEYGATSHSPQRPGVAAGGQAAAEALSRSQTGTWLTVSGTDPDGPADGLRYEWYEASGRAADIYFPNDDNKSHSAGRILVAFRQPGTYRLRVRILDVVGVPYGDLAEDTGTEVTVNVDRVISHARVDPPRDWVRTASSKQYTATPLDQFGQSMSATTTWTPPVAHGTAAAGSITPGGLYTAPNAAGRVSVKADVGSGVVGSATADVRATATVAARHVAYRGSLFAGDDYGLRAPDKTALRPGQGQATFANYTSYTRGINCVIIDVAGLWAGVTAADFAFRAGNSADPSIWPAAPTPSVDVVNVDLTSTRRIFLRWPDYDRADPNSAVNAVANKWLQVTVLANDRTGLAAPDVFYFGNLIGDTGHNNTGLYATLAEDFSHTKQAAQTNPVAFDLANRFDHNRDGLVTWDEDPATWDDCAWVQANFFKTLYLITV